MLLVAMASSACKRQPEPHVDVVLQPSDQPPSGWPGCVPLYPGAKIVKAGSHQYADYAEMVVDFTTNVGADEVLAFYDHDRLRTIFGVGVECPNPLPRTADMGMMHCMPVVALEGDKPTGVFDFKIGAERGDTLTDASIGIFYRRQSGR